MKKGIVSVVLGQVIQSVVEMEQSLKFWDKIAKRYAKRPVADEAAYQKFILENLEGFIIGRCDWSYMIDCFVIFAKVGFRFIEMDMPSGLGNYQAPSGNILITQSGSDLGPLAVKIEFSSPGFSLQNTFV